MKREDIEKAAERSTEKYVENGNLRGFRGSYRLGFIEGADWRINIAWHDIKEMPENNRMILIIMQHDIPTVLGPDNTFFKEEVKDRQIHRWAYVDDLKPNMEE
jgi:hypothetical protein